MMSPPSCATAGRTRVSISSRICSMISESAGSSSMCGGAATWIPAAVPALNKGALLTKWSSSMPTTSGSSSSHETPGPAVTEMKSPPKNTPSTMPVANRAEASGEASAVSRSAKSRLPASITVSPGRNLRVAGLGVCSVRISMEVMWSRRRSRSSAERRRSGDHPPADGECGEQADDRDPPASGPHRLDFRLQIGAAGEHRSGQLAADQQPIKDDRGDVHDDQGQENVEEALVEVARGFGGFEADQLRQRAFVEPVLVDRDQSQSNLDGHRAEQCDDAERAERSV